MRHISQQQVCYVAVGPTGSSASGAILAAAKNHLIELLPNADKLRLLGVCEPFELTLSQVLSEPGEVTSHVYFPTEGFVSLISIASGSPGVEVGMVGREGMLGAQLVLGVTTSPLHSLVQGEGKAWRIPARTFRGQLARSSSLRRNLHRYLYVLMAQQSVSSACLRFHLTGQRLARWLLMCQDRACSDRFHVTQEFLAYMLGMRRVGITAAAGMLQQGGLIAYARGEVTVLDRNGLEAAACTCYAEDRNAYTQLLG